MHEYAIDDPDEDKDVLDGFISDDGKHNVVWDYFEVLPGLEYEAWLCKTHNRIYYGGCFMGGSDDS